MPSSSDSSLHLASMPCGLECMTCTFRKLSLFSELNTLELERLNKNKLTQHFKAGTFLFREGQKIQGLICLQRGKVKAYKTAESGNNVIIGLYKPVEFVALPEFMIHTHHHSSAIALEDVTVCFVAKADFFEVFSHNSSFGLKVSSYLASSIEAFQHHLVQLTQKHMKGRLAYALLYLKDFYGINPVNSFIRLQLKRSDLAEWTNMTTANVIRTLSAFAKDGLIEIQNKNIRIKNERMLKKESEMH
jgi:CRP-like cAMP-binding protein